MTLAVPFHDRSEYRPTGSYRLLPFRFGRLDDHRYTPWRARRMPIVQEQDVTAEERSAQAAVDIVGVGVDAICDDNIWLNRVLSCSAN